MKALIIPTWYPLKENPLGGLYHQVQAKALAEHIEVDVLFVQPFPLKQAGKFIFTKKTDIYSDGPLNVCHTRILNLERFFMPFFTRRYARALLRAYRLYEQRFGAPDVLHAQVSYPAGYAAALLSKKTGIPLVVSEHASYMYRYARDEHSRYVRFAFDTAARYLAVSEATRKELLDAGLGECEVLPNFIDDTLFDIPCSERNDGLFRVIDVATLNEVKRLDMLLRAVDIIVHRRGVKDIRVKIVGKGYYEKPLRQIWHSLGLEPYVEFSGALMHDELPRHIAACDAAVLTSKKETFGIPLIEAMACGKPCVATRCGGPEDFINDKNGLLCEVDDPDDIADKLLIMKRTYKNYDPEYLKKFARDNYGKDAVCARLIKIYESLGR